MNQDRQNTASTTAQEAIALLIDLAQRGEIDPWDVQVIEAIDRCLSELAYLPQNSQDAFEANLSQSGQAFLYASMLVLLKADTLEDKLPPEDNLEQTEGELDNAGSESRLPTHLERHLRRRPSARPQQRRPVTLQELINQLQQMAVSLEEKPHRPRSRRSGRQSHAQAARAIASLAHQENLTEMASSVEQFLTAHLPSLPPERDWLAYEQLLEMWSAASTSADNHHLPSVEEGLRQPNDRVGIFWALLLLSAQSKVELAQEEFYQDIKIRAPQKSS